MENMIFEKYSQDGVKPWADPQYTKVAQAFRRLYDEGKEIGSAVCVYHAGQPVVDLWAGTMLPNKSHLWQKDTMVSTFSASKAMLALCLLHLIDNGKARLEDLVVDHWPSFATVDQERKSQATLKHLLNHTVGMPIAKANRPGDVYEWEKMISALERSPLIWTPGADMAYHAVTFGHLVGEVVRRISGQMPSAYFAEHFAVPLQLEYTLRFQAENAARTTDCDNDSWAKVWLLGGFLLSYVMPLSSDWRKKYYQPCGFHYHPNTSAWRQAEAPAVTGYGTARALARVYGMLAQDGEFEGKRILSQEIVRQIKGLPERPGVVDELGMKTTTRIGLGFFFNHAPLAEFGPNENSFGHCGMGGTTSFADPDHDIGFAYVCNHLHMPNSKDRSMYGDRAKRLIAALYECLGEQKA